MWDQPADLLPTTYADAVTPPAAYRCCCRRRTPAAAPAVVARLDGLVITGGADVDPERYGAEPHPRTVSWRTDRDAWELALLAAAEQLVAAGSQAELSAFLDRHAPTLVLAGSTRA